MHYDSMQYNYVRHLQNPTYDVKAHPEFAELLSSETCRKAIEEISTWSGYQTTNMPVLDDFAEAGGVTKVWYKDESTRFGLGSFKALGGSYAVAKLAREYESKHGDLAGFSVATATDGNHGRSVAWGAKRLGVECNIFIHAHVSQGRADYMAGLGATIHRVDGNYDDSLVACEQMSTQHDWQIVSDTSWEGYETVPLEIMAGYSVMAAEIVEQLDGAIPSHFFIPAGCGGLAGAMLGYLWQVWGEQLPRIIVVESNMSDCVLQSLERQKIELVNIVDETVMAGLSCGEVSRVIWPLIEKGVADVVTIPDDGVVPIMRRLAFPDSAYPRDAIEAGECSTAGLATLLATNNPENADLKHQLKLNEDSTVLVLGTEGATDPDFYQAAMASEG